jgi:thiol:disulfide interchange protein
MCDFTLLIPSAVKNWAFFYTVRVRCRNFLNRIADIIKEPSIRYRGKAAMKLILRKFLMITVITLGVLACNATNLVLPETPAPRPTLEESSATTIPVSGPYNEKAIPQDDIDAALTAAKNDGKLVLLDFGANWCADCLVLSTLFEDPSVQPYLQENFHVVQIDVGYWDKNPDTVQKYGFPIEKGIPAIVVLTADGKTIATTKDGALANARTATAAEILGYLKMWVAKKP